MKRVAIYARFSSDLQSDRSVDDQIALCRSKAQRERWKVVATFHDRAKSGASIFDRPGLAELMAKAKDGAFDVVIVEALDRLSRDQEDMAAIFKRLSFAGVELVTVHEGKADQIQVGIRSIVSALYLTDLAHKVRRGAAGNIREGKHAGGLAYGYRATPGKPGEWVIHGSEAEVIRRIFNEYLAGERTPAIAKRLNAEGIKPPRGSYWQAGTLTGSNNRHNGILGNEIYCGRLVWNRVRMIKDPETGKRVSRPNPESEWQRADAPHLAIITPELFDQAAALKATRAKSAPANRRRPKSLLSGLLRCGSCGGGMSIKGVDRGGTRIICSAFKNARACDNERTYYLHHVEDIVLSGLRQHLVDPRAIKHFLKTYHEERKRLAGVAGSERERLSRRLAEVTRKLERLTEIILDSDEPVSSFTKKIKALETDRLDIEGQLAGLAAPINVVALHPAAQQRYLAVVEDLARAVRARAPADEMVESVRELVESVTVHRTEAGRPIRLRVNGRLAALIGAPAFPEGSLSGVKVVAGARYRVNPRLIPQKIPLFPIELIETEPRRSRPVVKS